MPYIGNTAANRFVAPQAATRLSGNGSTVEFTLEHAVGSDEDILVSVDGVIQEPSIAYAVSSGTTLTFTAAPSSGTNNIFVYYLFRTVGTVSHPSNNALSASDITVDTTTLVTDSTNNRVGIGIASPSKTLHIRTADSSATEESNAAVIIEGTDATRADLQFLGDASAFQAIYFGDNSDADIGRIAYDHTGNSMRFNVNASERARIDSTGRLFVNTTTVRNSGLINIDFSASSHGAFGINDTASANGGVFIGFLSGGTFRAAITNNNNTAVAYNTTSDYRLKENVKYDWDATTRLKQLKPVSFNFIADKDNTVEGFLAHEAQEVVPQSVFGKKDEMKTTENVVLDKDENIIGTDKTKDDWEKGKQDGTYGDDTSWKASITQKHYQQIDHSKLVPLLTKSLQEALAEIDTLKTKVAALESK